MPGLPHTLLRLLGRALSWLGERLATAATPPAPPAPPAAPKPRPAQILVVDGDVRKQRDVLALLAELGMRATAAGTGEEAIGMLRGLRFDLLLMDCDLPNMDGPDSSRAIRAGAAGVENSELPIVGMAANSSISGPHGLAAGMSQVLIKPMRRGDLAPVLTALLPSHVGGTAPPRPRLRPLGGATPPPTALRGTPAASPAASRATDNAPDRATDGTTNGTSGMAIGIGATADEHAASVFDAATLLDNFGNDRAFARQIVAAMRTELPKRLSQLERAAHAADWEKARHLAGIIESQTVQIGGHRLAAHMRALEQRLGNGGRIEALELRAFKLAVSELDTALQAWSGAPVSHAAGATADIAANTTANIAADTATNTSTSTAPGPDTGETR